MLEYTINNFSTTKIKCNNDDFNRLTVLNYTAYNYTYLVQKLPNYLLNYFSDINHLEKFTKQELLTAALQWIREKTTQTQNNSIYFKEKTCIVLFTRVSTYFFWSYMHIESLIVIISCHSMIRIRVKLRIEIYSAIKSL